MITLAGHGKDERLIQVDLLKPIIEGDENYTPDYFLAPCKQFLGLIDLDPFSCELANKTIGAVNIFTREDDALTQDWTSFKRKWVNPPYSAGLIGKAIAKTLEYSHIGETLLLVNTSSSAKWFQSCMEKCAAYLHPSKRINFDSPFRTSKGNRYDQTLFYFGDRPLEFAEALSSLGNAVQPIRRSVLAESRSALVEDFAIGQFVDTDSCGKNLEIVEINGVILVCKNKQGQQFGVDRKFCSLTSTSLVESEPLALQPETLEKSPQLPISTSAKTRKKSISSTSQMSVSTQISEITVPPKELTSLQEASHVQEPVLQVQKLDLTTKSLNSGLNISDASEKDSPSLSLSRTPLDYSIAEWELSYKGYPKAGTMRNGKLSPLPSLEVPKREKEFLSLPTLTSNTATDSSRASGQSKLERWLKDKKFLLDTQVLSAEMMAILFGFPKDWTLCLSDAIAEPQEELDLDSCLGERSISTVQPLSSNESSTSIDISVLVESSSVRALDVLVESKNVRALDARYQFLLERREELINSGACPDGVWICCSEVTGKKFKQAVWKSSNPRPEWSGNKSQYIGKFMGEAHISAIAQHRAGQELRKIEREIRKLQDKKS